MWYWDKYIVFTMIIITSDAVVRQNFFGTRIVFTEVSVSDDEHRDIAKAKNVKALKSALDDVSWKPAAFDNDVTKALVQGIDPRIEGVSISSLVFWLRGKRVMTEGTYKEGFKGTFEFIEKESEGRFIALVKEDPKNFFGEGIKVIVLKDKMEVTKHSHFGTVAAALLKLPIRKQEYIKKVLKLVELID